MDGLRPATTTVRATRVRRPSTVPPARVAPDPGTGSPDHPRADASYSGAPDTLPAAMLDGDPGTGWSNAYVKSATALLPAFGGARPADWVSVTWAGPRTFDTAEVSFTIDATHTLPASVRASYWDGDRFVAVRNQTVTWATTSGAPTLITFDRVTGSRLRLDLTSAHPGSVEGAQRITTLTVPDA